MQPDGLTNLSPGAHGETTEPAPRQRPESAAISGTGAGPQVVELTVAA